MLHPSANSMPAIDCENLKTDYINTLKRPILDGISCKINQGQFIALLGLNGAGKSSLLRAIANLVPLQEGVVRINGIAISPKTCRREIGMLFQGGGLIRQLPAIENVLCGRLGSLSTFQTLWGFPKRDRRQALELLDRFGLREQAYQKTGQLSGGQQQKVAIARALIQSPQILLADEPTTGLDVMAAKQVMEILAELHRAQGLTIVVVLHDLKMAANYAERAIILDAGRIAYDGSCHNIESYFS